MEEVNYPKYVWQGLFLRFVNKQGKAIYSRPNETGAWSLEAGYVGGKLVCTSCWNEGLIGMELPEISEEKFLESNGNLPLKVLLE